MAQPKQKLIIKTDITDWQDEFLQEEREVTSKQDIIDLRLQGVKPAAIARAAIVSREKKIAPDDIMPTNKCLLNTGGSQHVSSIIAYEHQEATLPTNGATVRTRSYVAPALAGPDDESDDEALVTSTDERAMERAINYLTNYVMGNIYKRLVIVAQNNGNVREVGERLKRQIDEIVSRLV